MVGFVCAMAAAACAWPNGLNDGGALRETIHRTPVPAQTMHSRACRRLIASSPLSWSLAMMFFLPNVLIRLPAQPVDATQALNLSAGVSNAMVLRGRSFSWRATLFR